MLSIDLYDSLRLNAEHEMRPSSLRLFGNANIGNVHRCNLQVPGQLIIGARPPGTATRITSLGARTNLFEVVESNPDLRASWICYLRTFVTFSVGDRAMAEFPLWALFDSVRLGTLPRPITVPWRHNAFVVLESTAGEGGALFDAMPDATEDPFLWVHLKGEEIPPPV